MVIGALRKKSTAVFIICIILLLFITSIYNHNKNTSALAPTTSFRFVVIGDSQGSSKGINETLLRGLLQQVKGLSAQPGFILFTGDQVEGGSHVRKELADWKNIVDDYYPITSYYPTLGNHEDDKTIFSDAFNHLPNEQLPGYKRTAYYFDYGNSRFIVVVENFYLAALFLKAGRQTEHILGVGFDKNNFHRITSSLFSLSNCCRRLLQKFSFSSLRICSVGTR